MTVPNYTPEQCAEIRSQEPLNFEKAAVLGAKFGKKTRSIIAKAISLEVEYNAKPRATKSGEPIVLKSTLVSEIESKMGVSLPSLAKATKVDLTEMLERLN